MDWGGPEFVLGIIAIGTLGSMFRTMVYARHGKVDELGRRGRRRHRESEGESAADDTAALRAENARLKDTLASIEQRTRVLERIVTDGSYGVAAEIEALRDKPAPAVNGVPLGMDKERV